MRRQPRHGRSARPISTNMFACSPRRARCGQPCLVTGPRSARKAWHRSGRAESKLTTPVLVFGAERGVGQGLIDTLPPIGNDVRAGVMAGCGHYMPEEHPEAVGNELLRFFKTTEQLSLFRRNRDQQTGKYDRGGRCGGYQPGDRLAVKFPLRSSECP